MPVACGLLPALHAEDPLVTNPPPAVDTAFFDPATKPGDDFFQYANGGWIKRTSIPGDHSAWGITQEMEETNANILHTILEACAADAADGKAAPGTPRHAGRRPLPQRHGPGRHQRRRVYAARAGPRPDRRAQGPGGVAGVAGDVAPEELVAGLRRHRWQDEKNSTQQIAQLGQGGLNLPSNEYYTKTTPNPAPCATSTSPRRHHFLLRGEAPDGAARDAATVLRFETELARASRNPVELRDPEANYHKLTLAELVAKAPGFDWAAYFKELGHADPGPIDVGQPEFFVRVGTLAAETPLADWQTYLTWQVLDEASPYVGSDFANENFRFYGTILRGVEEQEPRWKRVLHVVDEGVGEALGQLYVADHFPPAAKQRALAMVNDLKDALRERIEAVDWMGADTKAAAVKKLGQLGVKIGYPDKWRDYSGWRSRGRLTCSTPWPAARSSSGGG